MKRGNGEGSIFKLSGKRRKPWAVRVTVGWTSEGKQKLKYVGYYRTKTEAKDALTRYIVSPYNLEDKKITVLEVYEKWLKSVSLSASTLRNYGSSFNRCSQLHQKPIRDLKVNTVETVIKELSPSMQHQAKNVLGRIFEFAEKNEIIEKNIVSLIQIEKRTAKKDKHPFTQDQVKQLLEYNDHIYADTIKILLYTGMRITELFDIKTENVHLEKRYMIGGKKTASGKNRIIPIHEDIYEIIKTRYEQGNEYLVTTIKGRQIIYANYLAKFWNPLKTEFNFDQTPHDTRHTFVTFASRQGLDRASVQKIIGHKGADITDHYTHRTKEELIDEVNKLKY